MVYFQLHDKVRVCKASSLHSLLEIPGLWLLLRLYKPEPVLKDEELLHTDL